MWVMQHFSFGGKWWIMTYVLFKLSHLQNTKVTNVPIPSPNSQVDVKDDVYIYLNIATLSHFSKNNFILEIIYVTIPTEID